MSASIQSIIYKGYGIAASALQAPAARIYRPTGATSGGPTDPASFVQTTPAMFDTDAKFSFLKPQIAGKNTWYALVDGTLVKQGDYIVVPPATEPGATSTWFLSATYPMQPIQATQCNAVLTVYHPEGNPGFGAQPYGGTPPSTAPILTAWPGSVIQGTKGEKGDSVLPRDVRMPWYAVFLPAFPGVTIQAADVIEDTQGRRYEISSCELVAGNWRLTAILAQT